MRTEVRIVLGLLAVACLSTSILGLLTSVDAQTHTMPGSNVVPSGASLTVNSGGSITAAAGSTVTGFGGAVSLTATTPIIVTPSPTTGTGVISLNATSKSNWDTAFTQMLQWDGGSTNLVAATGRTSLALNNVTNNAQTQAAIVPNTAPAAGQLLVGNLGGTAYAPVTLSGSGATISLASTGVMTISSITGVGNVSNSGTPVAGQIPIWTSATAIKGDTGLTYTGTGTSALLDIGGTDLGLARNAAGVLEINNGTAGQWGALKTGVRDTATATTSFGLTVGHQSTGAITTSFGTGILLNGNSDTTADRTMGQINAVWAVATDASRAGALDLKANKFNATAGDFYIFTSGGVNLGTFTDPGANVLNATGGYKAAGTTPSSGFFLQSNAAVYSNSTYALPTAGGTTGQIWQSNGTNVQLSTPTWPTTAGTAGYQVRSDGSNFASYPVQLTGASTTTVSAGYAADTYVAGSSPPAVTAGDFKASGQYHCVFDMTKTGAGVATPIITVRVGTAGAIGDAAVCTLTFSAGTGVIDSGMFEVYVNFRSVGSGTSAVFQAIGTLQHQGGVTGLVSKNSDYAASTSAGFNSSTATRIGLSFNGGSSFAGTNLLVQAQLEQP